MSEEPTPPQSSAEMFRITADIGSGEDVRQLWKILPDGTFQLVAVRTKQCAVTPGPA